VIRPLNDPPARWSPDPPARRLPGSVSLVGAGPGDPELLTRRAALRLAAADLVLYDALVDPKALDLAPAARRVFVGRRAGRPSMRQEIINRLMIRAARRGQKVVRLKGGDPFVFGRGGEEALALAAAGVAYEIVPGVTSAVAAPALAGIPVTHRGLASGFLVISGHAEEAYRPALESLAPRSVTVVILMALRSADSIAQLMIERGWPPRTPVGVVLGASTDTATAWTTTLAGLRYGIEPVDRVGPGTLVIGQVVTLRTVLAARTFQRDSHGNNRTA
jgi:uroporphyrin-III C-methyltransferase / precorrin-2 dehydrogenase / sirohydrochlorin ferrochelatase